MKKMTGVPCVENESVYLVNGDPCLHFRPLILAYSLRIVLQTVCVSFLFLKRSSRIIFPLQKVLIELPVLLERHDLLVVQENRGFLDALLSRNKTPVNVLDLDLTFSCVSTHRHRFPRIGWKV